jgi:hypothetical protein
MYQKFLFIYLLAEKNNHVSPSEHSDLFPQRRLGRSRNKG